MVRYPVQNRRRSRQKVIAAGNNLNSSSEYYKPEANSKKEMRSRVESTDAFSHQHYG
jgi:hypothetical protein